MNKINVIASVNEAIQDYKREIILYTAIAVFLVLPFFSATKPLFFVILNVIKEFFVAIAVYFSCIELYKIKNKHIIACIIFITLVFVNAIPAYSEVFEAGITHTDKVQKAHDYVFKYVPVKLIDPKPYQAYATQAPEGYRNDYSDGRYSVASGNKMYGYQNNKLIVISIYDKNVFEYPRKSYRYEYPSGKLESIAYGTSEGNGYEFRPDGSLIGIWENGIFYMGDKIKLTSKTTYF